MTMLLTFWLIYSGIRVLSETMAGRSDIHGILPGIIADSPGCHRDWPGCPV